MENDISHIFRSYDIRGIYGKDLNENIMEKVGNIFGQYCNSDIVLGRDARIHSKSLRDAFALGFIRTGKNIFDICEVPIGAGMFFAWKNKMEFAFITASHLPKEWNGIKFFHSDGMGYLENENLKIRDMFLERKYLTSRKVGKIHIINRNKVINDYKNFLNKKIKSSRKIKIVLDCGNGMAGLLAKKLFQGSNFMIKVIFDKIDCTFPNRNPEPEEDDLIALKNKIKEEKADMGIAYDGDGDRMLILDEKGRKLTPEQTSYLILLEAVKEKGPIVANVECTKLIDDIAKKFNKNIIRSPVGHTFLVNATKVHNACFGLEASGHYVLPFLFPFDDSLAVSLYAAYVLSNTNKKLSEIADEVKPYPFERINFNVDDRKKFKIIEKLIVRFKKEYKNVNTMDGIRIDFDNGFILIRASNTSPIIRLTVEGNTEKDFIELKNKFMEIIKNEIKK
ncbi:MAG: hypothetical protein QXD48_01670 [Candidatus Aenigmatarchaeota archaeon]